MSEQPLTPEQIERLERRASIFWPGLIVSLLLVNIGICTMTVIAASRSNFVLEPDYYQKALDWDEEKAARARLADLGWQVTGRAGLAGDLTVSVTDAQGKPADTAVISAMAFPHADAGDRREFTTLPESTGLFTAVNVIDRPGLWEVRLSLAAADDPDAQPALAIIEVERSALTDLGAR